METNTADIGDEGPTSDHQRRLDAMLEISAAWTPGRRDNDCISEAEDLYDPETGLPA